MNRLLLGLLLSLLCVAARAQSAAQPTRDGLLWADGRLLLLRQGSTRPVTREVRLPGGTRITPNGHVTLPTGRQGSFRAGDGVDPATGTWFARRARNPDGTTFLPLPIRLELPAPALGPLPRSGGSSTARPYHYQQRQRRNKGGRRLPDQDEEDDED